MNNGNRLHVHPLKDKIAPTPILLHTKNLKNTTIDRLHTSNITVYKVLYASCSQPRTPIYIIHFNNYDRLLIPEIQFLIADCARLFALQPGVKLRYTRPIYPGIQPDFSSFICASCRMAGKYTLTE